MITVLVGENSFEVQRALERIKAAADTVETYDGADLSLDKLPDILMGATLFADKRTVVVRGLSDNTALWAALSDWLGRVSDDIHLVLIEPKPDKRTKTYKELQKNAHIQEYKPWTERDQAQAIAWARAESTSRGLELSAAAARTLVGRTGVDQWAIHYALEKLVALGDTSERTIEEVIDASPQENIFQLFETALKGDRQRLNFMIRVLEQTQDPYQVFGLLSGQVFQLAALSASHDGQDDVAKDFGVHPFVLSKLRPYAARLGVQGVRRVVAEFALADKQLKRSVADPWTLIEKALLRVQA